MRRLALLLSLAIVGCSSETTTPTPATTKPTTPSNPTVPATPAYVPGQSYFGTEGYIEYVAGNAPVILTAPHGGALVPGTIPDRTDSKCGGSATTVTDVSTIELVRAMQARYYARFGQYPHVVIAHLSRRKLDANRTEPEASCGNLAAQRALSEWHAFIDLAKSAVLASHGKGWYMDIHGHGHAIQRLELGYLLTPAQLDLSDAALNANRAFGDTISIRTLAAANPGTAFATLLRGPNSLGSLYAAAGFPAIPSAADPSPKGDSYFDGGDDTRRHTCGAWATGMGGTTAGMICGVQIETNYSGVRDNAASRDRFGDATAAVLEDFLSRFWGLQLRR